MGGGLSLGMTVRLVFAFSIHAAIQRGIRAIRYYTDRQSKIPFRFGDLHNLTLHTLTVSKGCVCVYKYVYKCAHVSTLGAYDGARGARRKRV
jgi:hypothetical protein